MFSIEKEFDRCFSHFKNIKYNDDEIIVNIPEGYYVAKNDGKQIVIKEKKDNTKIKNKILEDIAKYKNRLQCLQTEEDEISEVIKTLTEEYNNI